MKTALSLPKTPKERPYPRLMRPRGEEHKIVLFYLPKCGVVVHNSTTCLHMPGYHSQEWDMDLFEDLPQGQKIVLEN